MTNLYDYIFFYSPYSEGSSLPRSLGGVSGAGQSNLSTEVAALIQSEMASQSRLVLSRFFRTTDF